MKVIVYMPPVGGLSVTDQITFTNVDDYRVDDEGTLVILTGVQQTAKFFEGSWSSFTVFPAES